MQNQLIVSPFFLDQPLPAAERLALPDGMINKPPLSGEPQMARMSIVHESLAGLVAEVVKRGQRPLSVSGDCCTAIGVLAGLQRAGVNPTLLWLDAHGDFNTWDTTPSGFVGGMPLAMIAGRGDQTLMQAVALAPLPEQHIFLADARDLDPKESEALQQSRVRHVADLSALPQLLPPDRPLYVHLDADVLDAQEAPAMLYPVKGGPSLAALRKLAERLASDWQIKAVSMTLWKLDADHDRRTERASMALFQALLGKS